tara:strand:- start:7902 stop:10358 length:2457 start_codon:yes stop_codon:yes gene_type:complete
LRASLLLVILRARLLMAKKRKQKHRKSSKQAASPKSESKVVQAPKASGTPGAMYVGLFVLALGISYFVSRPNPETGGPLQPPPPGTPIPPEQQAEKIFAAYAGSDSCRACHENQFNDWKTSHHGLAEREIRPDMDNEAFDPHREIRHASQTSEARKKGEDDYELVTLGKSGKVQAHGLKRAIGVSPLLQYLVEEEGGRYQAAELAWDPHKKEWFNVYGNEDRVPGEWGHWTGRGMNWNAMCASCHNTRLLKNYDLASDSYDTRMAEMGVGCESCHGGMNDHVEWQNEYVGRPDRPTEDPTLKKHRFSRDQMRDNCGPCHARRTELTGDYVPGESFFDHYSLVVPDETDVFYPDGQVWDEDYEFTSFLSSRMHAAGVRCFDCHNPHTAKLRIPGNLMCMTCHGGEQTPETEAWGMPKIPKIDPIAHSHHKSETEPGGRCVDCHMPLTTYMQRHPRRDHGFTIPDPLLTKQFGIPNACNRCHDDKDANWALANVEKWYGEKMNRPYRIRSQWVAMAKTNAPRAHINLIDIAQNDTNFLWRAVSAGLMRGYLHEPTVREELLKRLTDKHPLVRGTAVLSLDPVAQQHGSREQTAIHNLLQDPVRKVRIDAAWALRSIVDTNTIAGRELLNYFAATADQPAGMMQQGVFHYDRTNYSLAADFFRRASTWDTNSAAPHHELAVTLSQIGENRKAVDELRVATKLAPEQAEFRYKLALGLHELGDVPGATRELEATVEIDPNHGSALYNLGLAYDQLNRTGEALSTLRRAERADQLSSRAPYARATILARMRRQSEAIEAVRQALRRNPNDPNARQLYQQLGGK